MYYLTEKQSMGQPGKIAFFSVRSWSAGHGTYFFRPRSRLRIGLARPVRPSRFASACSFSILRLNLVFTRGIPPAFRGGVHYLLIIPPTTIGPVPSLSGHASAYRRRSPPRVRRHRASTPQCCSSNGCCLVRYRRGPFFVRLYFPTYYIILSFLCYTVL